MEFIYDVLTKVSIFKIGHESPVRPELPLAKEVYRTLDGFAGVAQ